MLIHRALCMERQTKLVGLITHIPEHNFIFPLKIREVWNTYELDLVNYQNKCRLIRGWDDLFNKVKEHINSVSAMKLSPYYKVEIKLICLLLISH